MWTSRSADHCGFSHSQMASSWWQEPIPWLRKNWLTQSSKSRHWLRPRLEGTKSRVCHCIRGTGNHWEMAMLNKVLILRDSLEITYITLLWWMTPVSPGRGMPNAQSQKADPYPWSSAKLVEIKIKSPTIRLIRKERIYFNAECEFFSLRSTVFTSIFLVFCIESNWLVTSMRKALPFCPWIVLALPVVCLLPLPWAPQQGIVHSRVQRGKNELMLARG